MQKHFLFAILIFAILAIFSGRSLAGPFGTNMDDPPEKYGSDLKKYGERIFRTEDVPKKHPLLPSYDLWFKDGKLFKVEAFSQYYPSYDEALKVYETLQKQLIGKYGPFKLDESSFGGAFNKKGPMKKVCAWADGQFGENIREIDMDLQEFNHKFGIRLIYKYENAPVWMPYKMQPKNDGSDAL